MRKKLMYAVLCCLLALSALFAASCGLSEEPETSAVVSVDVAFDSDRIYVRNEQIDLSDIKLTVVYDNGKTDTIDATNEKVSVTGADTSTAGEHSFVVKYGEFEKSFPYKVRNTILTLIAGKGTFADETTSKTIETTDNYTLLDDYQPIPPEDTYEFAGWFLDENFTVAVSYPFAGKVETASDLTLYAGYDIDYSDAFTYSISDKNEVTLLTFNPVSEIIGFFDFTVPETVKLLPVVEIADDFWDNSNVFFSEYTALTFGENSKLRKIGRKAFVDAMFYEITFPDTLESIGESAFTSSLVEELLFPASLRRIENNAFESSQTLNAIKFGENSKLEYIGEKAFSLCGHLAEVTLPDGVTTIGASAFYNSEMLSIVNVGRNVNDIGLHAFGACSNLREINVDENNAYYKTIDGNLFTKDGKRLVRYCFGTQAREYTVPNGVTDILESAFDCYNMSTPLEKIILPDSVVSIWAYAFRECSAEVEIPSSVKNIGDFAFSKNALTSFKVSPENKNFVTHDGSLYTSDMKELVAVPALLATDTFVLPSSVEKVRSGAIYFNYNNDSVQLKYIVIPENSSLTTLAKESIVPGSCRTLSGIFIETKTPFDMAADAMSVEMGSNMSNKSFAVYVKDDVLGVFQEAWKNNLLCMASDSEYSQFDEVLLKDYIYSVKTITSRLISEFSKQFNAEFSNVDAFASELDSYIKKYSLNGGYHNFEQIYRLLDSVYESGADLTEIAEFLKVFESKSLSFLADQYSSYDDYKFGTTKSFYSVVKHFNEIPATIKSDFSEAMNAKFTPIVNRTDEFAELQRNNINEIASMVKDYTNWDIERAEKAYEDSMKYGWYIAGYKWSDQLNQFRLDCSIKIYYFLQTELTAENLEELRYYLNGNPSDYSNPVYGILFYFNSHFSAEIARKTLYKYDEFSVKYKQMQQFIADINAAMENYDVANFNEESYRKIAADFKYLKIGEFSDEAYAVKTFGQLRLSLIDFLKTPVTEENYSEKVQTYVDIERTINNDNTVLTENCGASENDVNKYEEYAAQLETLFAAHNSELIKTIKEINSDNFLNKIEQLQKLYETAAIYENEFLLKYPIEITVNGETITDTLSNACISLIYCKKIVEVTQSFDSITADNQFDYLNMIYGSNGVAFYENLSNSNYLDYYQIIGLTNEIITKYNELFNQYKEV